MDDDIRAKANPNVVLALDYLAAGVLIAVYFYCAVVAKLVPADGFTQVLTAGLSMFAGYKINSYGQQAVVTNQTPQPAPTPVVVPVSTPPAT